MRVAPALTAFLFLITPFFGCRKATTETASKPAVDSSTAGGAGGGAASSKALAFIEDDYQKALADAKARGRLLFIDVWAPWCHTCLSLKSFVLTDPSIVAEGEAFTWAAIDSEKPQNAALVEKLKLAVLPTLWVIDPNTEQPIWTWKGALTAVELKAALADVRKKREPASPAAASTVVLAEAEVARGNSAAAIDQYRAALAAPAPFPERARAADAFVALLEEAKRWDECIDVATREGKTLPEGTYRVDVAVVGARCAIERKETARDALTRFEAELSTLTQSTSSAVLDDDRSSAFETLIATQKAKGDPAGAKTTALAWAKFLEDAAGKAKSPKERAVFDSHRLGAYLELGQPERALPMLEASQRDFPDDYNPSARKARALLELQRYDEALAATDHALARAYGARRLRIFVLRADVFAKKKDAAGERRALEAALAEAKALPLRASYEKLRVSIEERLNVVRR